MKMYTCNVCKSWWMVPDDHAPPAACFGCASADFSWTETKQIADPIDLTPDMIIASLRAELDLVRKERDVLLVDKRTLAHNLETVSSSHEHLRERVAELEAPIEMIMSCPACHTRHVDVGDFAAKPHRNHACQNPECGIVFRICDRNTVGVRFLPGYQDDVRWLFKPGATFVDVRAKASLDWRALEVWRDGLEDPQIKGVIAALLMEIRALEGEVEIQSKIARASDRARQTGFQTGIVMLPVFEAAKEWRKGRDRDRAVPAPPGTLVEAWQEIEDVPRPPRPSEQRLVEAVDEALSILNAKAFDGLSVGVVMHLLDKAVEQAKSDACRVEGECS